MTDLKKKNLSVGRVFVHMREKGLETTSSSGGGNGCSICVGSRMDVNTDVEVKFLIRLIMNVELENFLIAEHSKTDTFQTDSPKYISYLRIASVV